MLFAENFTKNNVDVFFSAYYFQMQNIFSKWCLQNGWSVRECCVGRSAAKLKPTLSPIHLQTFPQGDLKTRKICGAENPQIQLRNPAINFPTKFSGFGLRIFVLFMLRGSVGGGRHVWGVLLTSPFFYKAVHIH